LETFLFSVVMSAANASRSATMISECPSQHLGSLSRRARRQSSRASPAAANCIEAVLDRRGRDVGDHDVTRRIRHRKGSTTISPFAADVEPVSTCL
jgi:hypothetical protein